MPALEQVGQHELGEIVALRAKAREILALADEKAKGAAGRLAKYGYEGGMYRGAVDGAGRLVIARVDGAPL